MADLDENITHLNHICPRCQRSADRLKGVETDQQPEAGDLAICAYCGFIEEFIDGEEKLARKEFSFNSVVASYAEDRIKLDQLLRMIGASAELYAKWQLDSMIRK